MIQLNKYYLDDHTPAIPDGKTVEPTDDIQTWIKCAGRKDLYTTLADVLADTTCLAALIADNNACDYLVRSTTWTTICSDVNAMTDIGANNYAADTLLYGQSAAWPTAILNSIYFERVLNYTNPTMTSSTTPEGTVNTNASASSSSFAAWKAFDHNLSTSFYNDRSKANGDYVEYVFAKPVKVFKTFVSMAGGGISQTQYCDLSLLKTDGNRVDIKNISYNYAGGYNTYQSTDNQLDGYIANSIRLTLTGTSSGKYYFLRPEEIQVWGRVDV